MTFNSLKSVKYNMCIQIRNFVGAPAPGAPMFPVPLLCSGLPEFGKIGKLGTQGTACFNCDV